MWDPRNSVPSPLEICAYISDEVDSMIDESLFTETKQKICYTGNSLQTGETENFVDCM